MRSATSMLFSRTVVRRTIDERGELRSREMVGSCAIEVIHSWYGIPDGAAEAQSDSHNARRFSYTCSIRNLYPSPRAGMSAACEGLSRR